MWESIVARDSSVVAQAVQRALVAPYLERAFPGRPCAVRFGFDFTKPPTPKEVFEVAAIAKQAGWTIDKAQLEEQTGYTLVQDAPQQLPAGGLSASPSGGFPFMNKAPAAEAAGAPEASDATDGVLAAFARDTGPAADAVRALLADPTPEAARDLLARLPSLIPEDPALAAVLAEEMAKEFGPVASDSSDAVANKLDENGQEHAEAGSGNGGQFVSKEGGSPDAASEKTQRLASPEEISSFLEDPKDRISPELADALLEAGFEDKDGDGNTVKYGSLLREHIDRESHSEKDRLARKRSLGNAVRFIRSSKAIPSGGPNRPNERVYAGKLNGKAYIGIADEHGELNALVMVSYRRDARNDDK